MSTYLAWQKSSSFTACEWDSPELASNLTLTTLAAPDKLSLAPHTALVRLRAVSLNFRDLLTVASSSLYPTPLWEGIAPCSDGAGEVVAAGADSTWRVGDRVVLTPNTWHSGADQRDFKFDGVLGATDVQGALRQLAVVADDRLIAAPVNASYEEAACLPVAGVSAMRALFGELPDTPDRVREGDWVLTQGTGGVSLWAVQLAAAVGAKVIATSSSDVKLETARRLGATHTVNYGAQPDWHEEVLRITGGLGVDRVIEVGGSATLLKSLKATRMGGVVVVLGMLTNGDEKGVAAEILFGAKTVMGQLGGSADVLRRLISVVDQHDLHPVIGEAFKLQDVREAFKTLQKQNTVGKIVITL